MDVRESSDLLLGQCGSNGWLEECGLTLGGAGSVSEMGEKKNASKLQVECGPNSSIREIGLTTSGVWEFQFRHTFGV
jgi:hypothetical protein